MKENSRFRFNPSTKEVEIEGSEEFVSAMFNKIQKVMSGASIRLTKEPTIPSSDRIKKAGKRKVLPAKRVKKVIKVQEKAPRMTLFDKVVGHILESNGLTTSELEEKTGLTDRQIWGVTAQAVKLGRIKKSKRGLYEAAT